MTDNISIENTFLKKIMQDIKCKRSEENINLFFNEVAMNAHFVCIAKISEVPKSTKDGKNKFINNADLDLQVVTSDDGKIYYTAFSDIIELKKYNDDDKFNIAVLNFES
ncbi:SseB family protein [Anaeromicropila herbilytica]|uniref:Uncharacterized protein n=1 Tax=Anaeromicropila herbilytica TaxID=2785025 RepID=A0A7R7ENY2_9FIRM|nr:SseB family protein [Anaeromicropila herbilytica]BCN32370.1 hypothetical protein bsdtb5_36650 [Anaeromicropila herbilytica]